MLRSFFKSAPMGAAAVFCLATAGCAATSNDNQEAPPPPPPEMEEPLELTVDDLALRNGTLRISATMTDGSADVSMWLGDACDPHEVGHGFATRAGFTWALSADDVTRAFECGLVVNAHGVNEDGERVKKIASLDVSPQVVEDETDVVHLVSTVSEGKTITLRFSSPVPPTHLHIAGTVVGAEDEPPPEELPEPQKILRRRGRRKPLFQRSFIVDNDDLAASMLHRRRLSVSGEHFLATVTIGNVTLDVSDPVDETFGDG